MLHNHLKLFWRTLTTQWRYSLINISSLAIALACCMLIALHVADERRYDRFHQHSDNIYRIARTVVNSDGQQEKWATTMRAIALTMKQDLSEVEAAATFARCEKMSMTHEGQQFLEQNIIETDSNFFKVFTVEFLDGDPERALDDAQSIILTASTARRYFGRTDVIGSTMRSESAIYTVTGIVQDFPAQSHFHFDMAIPLRTIEIEHNTNWLGMRKYHTFVRLNGQATASSLAQRLPVMVKKYAPGSTDTYFVQALTDIHLHSHLRGELEANGDARTLDVLLVIALFVIVSAGVNYTNLASAQATTRAKEIGVRKTSGATKRTLVAQFLLESVMMTIIAFVAAALLVMILVLPFNDITGKTLEPLDRSMMVWWAAGAVFAITVGLLAGIYPGLFLSSFNPVKVLKGGSVSGTGYTGLSRKYLVGFQFAVSVSLILVTIMIYRQMNFIRSKDPGFNKEQVLLISNAGRLANRYALEDRIKQLAGISYVGASTALPGSGHWTSNMRVNPTDNFRVMDFCQVNYDYIDALGIHLVAGRNFSPQFPADTVNSIILNETAVKDLNLEDPVGHRVIWDEGRDTVIYAIVVGVVKDFHYQSFHETVRPFALLVRNTFFVHGEFTSNLFVKFDGAGSHKVVSQVESIWKQLVPERPFTYTFLDDSFANLHVEEARFTKLFSWITVIGIFISSIGLFGLIAFVSEQRTREIGIRKVLGASISSLMLLINSDVLKVGFIALMISSPVAAYLISMWLQGFAYHVEITWEIFVLVAAATFVLLFIATGYHSLRAATRSPVKSLKVE